jgi:predicted TIM-barrel fold metal-dependent hydrolase
VAEVGDMDRRQPIVDPHQHFWDLGANRYPWLQDEPPIPFRYGDYSAIRRTYLPPDFRRDTAAFNIVKTVHIEAEWDRADPVAETRWLEGVQAEYGLPSACIAHAELDAEGAPDILAAQAARPLVRGIRHKPAAAPSPAEAGRGAPGSMDDPRWRRGYALLAQNGLSFDLQTNWWHMEAAAALARDFPETQIIVNHTGLPADRSAEGLAGWRRGLEAAAREPNIAIKVSGIGLPGQAWTLELNGPVIREAISIFGADRAMFASNFPVDSLVATYDDVLGVFLAAIAERPEAERRKLVHDNAMRFYRL